jgi:hypothetical protein
MNAVCVLSALGSGTIATLAIGACILAKLSLEKEGMSRRTGVACGGAATAALIGISWTGRGKSLRNQLEKARVTHRVAIDEITTSVASLLPANPADLTQVAETRSGIVGELPQVDESIVEDTIPIMCRHRDGGVIFAGQNGDLSDALSICNFLGMSAQGRGRSYRAEYLLPH